MKERKREEPDKDTMIEWQAELGEVPHQSVDFGQVRGDNIHPETETGLKNGELKEIPQYEFSKPGLASYAKVIQNVGLAGGGIATLGALLYIGFRIYRARRHR